MRATGAAVPPSIQVMAGAADNAFCAVRPPGHHAEPDARHGLLPVQQRRRSPRCMPGPRTASSASRWSISTCITATARRAFWTDTELFYGSTHQMPLYPGTGARARRGRRQYLQCAARARRRRRGVSRAFATRILPALDAFAADFLLVSAGFDAHVNDPLAQIRLESGFRLGDRAAAGGGSQAHRGKLVSTLEGGYDLDALAASAAAHVGWR